MTDFVHLHNHSEYSLLDGAAKVEKIPAYAQSLGMDTVALTDHGNMSGAIDFYNASKANGIKPIIGCEIYVADAPLSVTPNKDSEIFHLILLAQNDTGYKNLIKLTTAAYLEGFYRKPRVDHALLEKFNEGLICTSACASSEVATSIYNKSDMAAARDTVEFYRETFRGRYYLELQDHGLEFDNAINEGLIQLAKEFKLPLICTNDVHYLEKRHSYAQKILVCMNTHTSISSPSSMSMTSQELYLKPASEMEKLFGHIPGALENTRVIADQCNLEFNFGRTELPAFEVPRGQTSKSYLEHLANQGLEDRYSHVTEELQRRLDYELDIITRTGYEDYILLVWDIIRFAKGSGIGVGPGRGSAAGSLVCYCLEITNIDPIMYGLSFERFLNPDRVSMPDIDMDFADDRRDEVFEYTKTKYGYDHVAQIITFGTVGARGGLRDVARATDYPYVQADTLAKMVPDRPGITLDEAIEEVPELQEIYDQDSDVKIIFETLRDLEGVARHSSTHAAGVVISKEPLSEVVPLLLTPKERKVTTQYAMEAVEKIGLLKMDFLGLRTLTIIQRTCQKIKQNRGIDIDPDHIDLEDPAIYDLLSTGENFGIFQVDGSGLRAFLRQLQPTEFRHVVAAIALYRPGPMEYIGNFANRKNGTERIVYKHPAMKEALEETFGIMVYQEQVIRMAQLVAGYSAGEGDLLRKAIGKKKKEELDMHREQFIERAVEHGTERKLAEQLFTDVEPFARYAFNKCASAKTYVYLPSGERIHISAAYKKGVTEILSMWEDGEIRPHKIKNIVKTGRKTTFRVVTSKGRVIRATKEHRLLTTEGYMPISEMKIGETELITRERVPTSSQISARRANMKNLNVLGLANKSVGPNNLRKWQSEQTFESRSKHQKNIQLSHPDRSRTAIAAMHDKVKWLHANDPVWRQNFIEKSLASVRRCYDTGPGWGNCSIATDGTWCASNCERMMCEYLIENNIPYEAHKVLANGRICDFYFDGIYWEMDGLDRTDQYFKSKYGYMPYVVVTPDDFRYKIEKHLNLSHASNGDTVVSIEYYGEEETYDIEMDANGPLNFVANNVISHNSHSASYAVNTCVTAYLKAHYPLEFMAGYLSAERENFENVKEALTECRRMGIAVLPPNINKSSVDFQIEDDAIRFGLASVKGVGDAPVQSIVDLRDKSGPYTSLVDYLQRAKGQNKKVIDALGKVGAYDDLGVERNQIVHPENIDTVSTFGAKLRKNFKQDQLSLFADEELPALKLDLSKVPVASVDDRLDWEAELVGYYITPHPFLDILDEVKSLGILIPSEIDVDLHSQKVSVAGIIKSSRKFQTKAGAMMAKCVIEDLSGSLDVVIFNKNYEKLKDEIRDRKVVIVSGRLDVKDGQKSLFADNIQSFEEAKQEPSKLSFSKEKVAITKHQSQTQMIRRVKDRPLAKLAVHLYRSPDRDSDREKIYDIYGVLQKYQDQAGDWVEIFIHYNDTILPLDLPNKQVNICEELEIELDGALAGFGERKINE